MRTAILMYILVGFATTLMAQNVDLSNSTDYVRIQKNGETDFSRAFGLNSSNHLYIGSVEKTIGNIYFFNKGADVLATLTPNGNMGIGTNNPSARLNVAHDQTIGWNNLANATILVGNTTTGLGLDYNEIAAKNTDLYLGTIGAGKHLHFRAGSPNNMMVMSGTSGNVGIGTGNPDEKLKVVGTASVHGDIGIVNSGSHWQVGKHTLELSNSDAGDVVLSFHRGGYTNAAIKHTSLTGLIINGGGAPDATHLFVHQNGNLGIGTTNPGSWKLAVKGKIRAEEVKVETGWSDFVFEKHYDLPTLEEVERHIKDKGHLKDIPSAKEVAENGILLGEMDSKLLQKIEELTLYTIEQEKRIKQLETENEKLLQQENKILSLEKKLNAIIAKQTE